MRAVILGCAGPSLSEPERQFLADADPFGFILFRRNCETPEQLSRLTADLRASVGRDAPVLIDQEGGRVLRLRAPHWYEAPAPGTFGDLYAEDREVARRAARANATLTALDLAACGVDVNCVPSLDLRLPSGHKVVGDRSLGPGPDQVADLGRAVCDGTRDAGVLPVIKHMPGHGRSTVDSHDNLPRVDASRQLLSRTDFAPFKAFAREPMGMTGHLLFEAIDPDRPTTCSPTVIAEVIRGEIGFDGLLLTDDISMRALSGSVGESAHAALAAGCDIVLHCNGEMPEMEDVVANVRELTDKPLARAEKAIQARDAAKVAASTSIDREALLALAAGCLGTPSARRAEG
jgi:beta-N-acetylhexosaminidase